jgi:flavin reductase
MVDSNLYKQVMRRYATGVMVLTVRDGEGFHAVTVNSVVSVSLDPILLSVSLEKNARSHELMHKAGTFALSILSDKQIELGKKFAYDREARNEPRAQAAWYVSERGELLFEETLGYFECRVTAEYEGGDHTIFLGAVIDTAVVTDALPLLYYQGGWHSLHE